MTDATRLEYQKLFDYMSENHGVNMLESEIDDLMRVVDSTMHDQIKDLKRDLFLDRCHGPIPSHTLDNDLNTEMHMALREAERAAHAYAASCEVGEERTWAFEVFERIRLATRR